MNVRHERLKARSIPKKDLKEGCYYHGRCRNATIALWKRDKFWYIREKFTAIFVESINHPEDDNGFDLFYPFKEIKRDEEV